MTFDQILGAPIDSKLLIDDQEFTIAARETARLQSGDRMTWIWASDGSWLVVDADGDELIALAPVEQEVELDEEGYAMYLGNSYEEMYEDQGAIEGVEGEDHEEGDAFVMKQFETDRGEVLRRLTWAGYGEEIWFIGKMVMEVDVRPA